MKWNSILIASFFFFGCSSDEQQDVEEVTAETSKDEESAGKRSFLQIDKFLLTEVPLQDEVTSPKAEGGGTTLAELFAKRQYAKVEIKARLILKSNPHEPKAMVYLIQALLLQRKFSLALVYANLNHKRLQADADFMNARGIAHFISYKGNSQGIKLAQDAFDAASKLAGQHIASRANLGQLMLLTGRDQDALELFQKLKQECKQCYVAIAGIAAAATKLGKYNVAVSNWELAIKGNSRDYAARYYLAQTYFYGQKNRDKAKATVDALLGVLPKTETEWLVKARELQQSLGGGKKKTKDNA